MSLRLVVFPFLVFAALAISPVHSAAREPLHPLFPKCSGFAQLCGYYDRTTKAEVIPPTFERAMLFSEDLAAVRIRGQYGYIDSSGKLMIKPQFDLAGPFYQGLAEVFVDGAAGVINRSGELVVEPQFSRAIPFTSDTVIVSEGRAQQLRGPGNERIDGFKSGLGFPYRKPAGLYHVRHGWIERPRFKFSLFETEGRGLIWANEERSSRGPWGLLRADGTWQVEPTYGHVQRLLDDRAVVRKPPLKNQRLAPSGAVDRDGKLVVPIEFQWLGYWSDGFGLAKKDGKEGLVTKDGKLVAGRYFQKVERDYYRGVGPRVFDGSKWMTVSPDGSLIKDQLSEAVYLACPSGLKLLHDETGGLRIIKPDGTPAADYSVDRLHYFERRNCGAPLSVRRDGKWGFVTQDGRIINDPPSFENQSRFQDGFAAVKLGGLWGIINLKGEMVVSPRYDEIRRKRGAYFVKQDGRNFWVSPFGVEIAEPVADDSNSRSSVLACREGAIRFERDGLWGIRGPKGGVIIEPRYRAISCFKNGLVWVPDDDLKVWCPLGPTGARQEKPACRQWFYEVLWSHHRPERLHADPYESSVLWNRTLLEYGIGRAAQPPFMVGVGLRGGGRKPAVRLR